MTTEKQVPFGPPVLANEAEERIWCDGWVQAYRDLWDIFAIGNPDSRETLGAALVASEQRADAMRAALVKIRDYEAGEDEQAREYGVLEPDKVGYCFGLANAALSATPPPAAPSVPDAAGSEEAKLLHGRILELLREIEWNGTSLWGGRPVAICPACFESREPNITGQGGHKVACPLALTIRQLTALAPAAQRAPASAGPGDAKAGGGTA